MNFWLTILPAAIVSTGAAVSYLAFRLGSRVPDRAALPRPLPALAAELPYWFFLQTDPASCIVVGVDGAISSGLSIAGIDTDCLSDDSLETLQRQIHAALVGIEPGTTVQFIQTVSDHVAPSLSPYRDAAADFGPLARRLRADKVERMTESGRLLSTQLSAFVTLPSLTRLCRPLSPFDPEPLAKRAHKLALIRDQLAAGLSAAGAAATPLSLAETRSRIYQALNPGRCRVVGAPVTDDIERFGPTARESLCLSDLTESASQFLLDGQLCRTLSLKKLPSATCAALIERLSVAVGFPFSLSVAIDFVDDEQVLSNLRRQRDQAQALAQMSARRNQQAEAKQADVEELIDQTLWASVRIVRMTLSITIAVPLSEPDGDRDRAEAEQVLSERTAEVLRAASALFGAEAMVDRYGQLSGYLAQLPANAHARPRRHTVTSENAAHLIPVWQSFGGHAEPAVVFENGRRHVLGLDPFDPGLDNPNAFVAGSSGAGKSVFVSTLLLSLLSAGAKAIVIDVGGSYRRLFELFDGPTVGFDPADDPALNLFPAVSDMIGADGRLDPIRRRFVLGVLELLCSQDGQRVTNEQRAVLDAAVTMLYRGRTPGHPAPVLPELCQLLWAGAGQSHTIDTDHARSLARRLRFFVTGPYARLLCRPSTITLTSDVAGFDLKGVSDDIRPVVLAILSGLIWNLVLSDRGAKKVIVFDEVWTLLSDPASSRLIEELYRTSRKYRASLMSISQSVDDFTDSPIASALINNAATTYLLRHQAGHAEVAEAFRLNPRERFVFENLEMRRGQYSEIFVRCGTDRALCRVVLSPLEYWIATTHPADVAALERVCADAPELDLLAALERCAERWPRGIDA